MLRPTPARFSIHETRARSVDWWLRRFLLCCSKARSAVNDTTGTVPQPDIPELDHLHAVGLPRWPVGDAMCFFDDFENKTPLAAVCLNDCYQMVAEARFALCEGLKQLKHYRGKEPPNEAAGVFFAQFYGADVALRLYAAAEHLASAIVEMLAIDRSSLLKRRRRQDSMQAMVGSYLASEMARHPLSRLVGELSRSASWRRTVDYRNLWVHEQAPLVGGMGLVYRRGKQYWKKFEDPTSRGYQLTFGGGDPPEISVDELLESVGAAFRSFFELLRSVAESYREAVTSSAARSAATSE